MTTTGTFVFIKNNNIFESENQSIFVKISEFRVLQSSKQKKMCY